MAIVKIRQRFKIEVINGFAEKNNNEFWVVCGKFNTLCDSLSSPSDENCRLLLYRHRGT